MGRRAAVPHAGLHRHPPRPRAGHQGGRHHLTFVTDGIEAALAQARDATGGKDIGLSGGANVAQQYLQAGLIDEMQLHVVPVLLGAGTRLFEKLGDAKELGRCIRAVETPGVTHLRYRVRK